MPKTDKILRKRYIAFSVEAPRDISRKEFITAIRKNAQGQDKWEKMEPWLTVFENNKGILRCRHTGCEEAIFLLTSIESIGKEDVKIKVKTLGTSGTIKKAKSRYLGLEKK
jgi:RNase P/RNase MRP subunit POP5